MIFSLISIRKFSEIHDGNSMLWSLGPLLLKTNLFLKLLYEYTHILRKNAFVCMCMYSYIACDDSPYVISYLEVMSVPTDE